MMETRSTQDPVLVLDFIMKPRTVQVRESRAAARCALPTRPTWFRLRKRRKVPVPVPVPRLAEQEPARTEMGNRGSNTLEPEPPGTRDPRILVQGPRRPGPLDQDPGPRDVPQISVTEASPLPAGEQEEEGGGAFTLPEPSGAAGAAGAELQGGPGGPRGEDSDTRSLSGSEDGGTPGRGRRRFIQVMMDSSPQVRRSVGLGLSSRWDSDSASSLASSRSSSLEEDRPAAALEEDRAAAALEPVEHEWMLCSSDGEWSRLQPLLALDPGLALRRDFVTGFTCLHWAAKLGRAELLALILDFSRRRGVAVSVDVRSSAGYTPLHVAAMHGHAEVVKLLVGAYGADLGARDFSGRRACQYLGRGAAADIRDIIGADDDPPETPGTPEPEPGGPWRFSRALRSSLKALSVEEDEDRPGARGGVVLRRRSSLSRMKPSLQRLRMRTSQLVHSVSFRDRDDLTGPGDGSGGGSGDGSGSAKARRKTHFLG